MLKLLNRAIVYLASLLGLVLTLCAAADGHPRAANNESLALAHEIAVCPRLLCYGYLSCRFGAPNHVSVLTSGTTRQALWFLPGTAILHYRLTQEVIPQIALQTGQALVQNQLEMFLPVEDQFPLQNAVDRFGMPSTSYFVTKNALSTRFVAAPNVTLLLNQAIDSSLINTVSITYEGEPLPVPETQELSEAAQCSNRKALAQHELNHYGESIPLYLTYLQQFPGDAVAHLRLAECYKQSGCLNQAIAQFSLALRFSGFDEPTRQAALQGLNALQIFPNSATAATRPAEQLDIGSPPRMSSLSEDVGF